MSCFLCLREFANPMGDDPSPNNEPRKIQISALCQLLLASCSPHKSIISHQNVTHQFEEDDETCTLCATCAPVIHEVEEIRCQMSKLEDRIRRKVSQIRDTISSSGQHRRDEKIMKMRDVILHSQDGEGNDNSISSDEFKVKVEQEEFDDDIMPRADEDEQLLNDYSCASIPFETESEEENQLKNDPLQLDEDDDDSAFCIVPSSLKKQRSAKVKSRQFAKIKTRSTPLRNKRKAGNSPMEKEDEFKLPKRIKKELRLRPSLEKTRSSPRTWAQKDGPPLSKVTTSKKKATPPPDDLISASPKSEHNDEDLAPKSEDENSDVDKNSDTEVVRSKRHPRHLPHKCTSCAKSYSTEAALTYHMARGHQFPCPACPVKLDFQRSLNSHLKRYHPNFVPHQCSLCRNKYQRKSALEAHMVMRHEIGEKKFSCVKCEKSFCLVENLERHLKLHDLEEVKPLVCDICDSRFEDDARLSKHVATHDTKKFVCDYCGFGCSFRQGLERHVRTHTGEKPEKCDQCKESFIDKYSLQNHVVKDHSGKKGYVCHICGKDFFLKLRLRVHLEKHEGTKKVGCDTCGEKFIDYYSFQSHRIKVHGADPFVCDECGATFISSGGLRMHKIAHAGVRQYKCDLCEASFVRKSVLDKHLKTHSKERPFPCPHCEKAFKVKPHLTAHVQRLHTPGYEPPIRHPCPHCDKGYPTNCFLQAHIRQVHTGERPFVCDQTGCGKGFAKKTSLYLHLKGHHGLIMERKCKDALSKGKRDELPQI
ncbi:zinc finger protein 2 homolog isoform X2 [Folsomia candida]|uniref:zinc finger protein 2 homolog isoform X2 n=1 Tax=Folsomia candida TaxID=158441 RepID=UPI001604E74D|nr:zinc finger protein 2 homolog isoform X2 [Folsomia candida]